MSNWAVISRNLIIMLAMPCQVLQAYALAEKIGKLISMFEIGNGNIEMVTECGGTRRGRDGFVCTCSGGFSVTPLVFKETY